MVNSSTSSETQLLSHHTSDMQSTATTRYLFARISQAAGEVKTDRAMKLPAGSIVGVSWWCSPRNVSVPQSWSVWVQDWLLSFRQLMNNILFLGRGGLNASRYWVYKQMQRETHQEIWKDPRGYYFCNVLCVSSVVRGTGIGKLLMDAVIDQADEEEMPCYLESSKGYPNVSDL